MTTTSRNPFVGAWRIVWMSGWEQDYVDMEAPGRVTFKTSKSGSFQFGSIRAELDCSIDRQQRIEFTWSGFDEGDELSGRGHAQIVDGELRGHLYIHLGDDSAFRAVRRDGVPKSQRKLA